MCQSIRQCSAYGKHPAVMVLVSPDGHVTSGSNVTNACIHSQACMMDLTWVLVRMPPLKLFGVETFSLQRCKECLGGVASMQLFTRVFLFWQTSGTVPWSMALQQSSGQGQGVPSCNAHSSWMCTQCWTLLGSHRFLKTNDPCCGVGCPLTVNSVFILSLLSAATCSTTQVEMLTVILPQLYHCWQWTHLQL